MTASPERAPHGMGIEAVAITKRFGEFIALDAVSLKIAAGTFHALLGENGAGKSTLVKCIMGYYRPDHGEVVVDNRERSIDNPRAAHALGLRHGLPALHPGTGHDGHGKSGAGARRVAGRD